MTNPAVEHGIWQCSGCQKAFVSRWKKVCPNCQRTDYWSGSVDPAARSEALAAAAAALEFQSACVPRDAAAERAHCINAIRDSRGMSDVELIRSERAAVRAESQAEIERLTTELGRLREAAIAVLSGAARDVDVAGDRYVIDSTLRRLSKVLGVKYGQ
jgi:hypothetical protein